MVPVWIKVLASSDTKREVRFSKQSGWNAGPLPHRPATQRNYPRSPNSSTRVHNRWRRSGWEWIHQEGLHAWSIDSSLEPMGKHTNQSKWITIPLDKSLVKGAPTPLTESHVYGLLDSQQSTKVNWNYIYDKITLPEEIWDNYCIAAYTLSGRLDAQLHIPWRKNQ